MSVLIKGAEMPTNCMGCPYEIYANCIIYQALSARDYSDCRHPDCPLVEIPPHGDLIDKGTLMESINETYCTPCPHDGDYNYCKACLIDDALDAIEDAPTVIESEEEQEEEDDFDYWEESGAADAYADHQR